VTRRQRWVDVDEAIEAYVVLDAGHRTRAALAVTAPCDREQSWRGKGELAIREEMEAALDRWRVTHPARSTA
jgi:hypothetical protein